MEFLPTFPHDFQIESRNKVVAAFAKATDTLEKSAAPSPGSRDRRVVVFIMTIMDAFMIEACELGKQRVWASDEIDRHVREFLRVLVIHTDSKYGNRYSMPPAVESGHITRVMERIVEESPEWKRYHQRLIDIAKSPPANAVQSEIGHAASETHPAPKRRLISTVTNIEAARDMERFIESSGASAKAFAKRAATTDRTLRTFRTTGKVRRDTFEGIAKAMALTPEEWLRKIAEDKRKEDGKQTEK